MNKSIKNKENERTKYKKQSIINSFRVAVCGILTMIKEERNMKIHILATIVVVALGSVLRISGGEWCAIAIVIGMVIAGELINSSIEVLVDVVMPTYDIRAKRIKDASAGAVLILAISALVVGAIIFAPKLYELFIYKMAFNT